MLGPGEWVGQSFSQAINRLKKKKKKKKKSFIVTLFSLSLSLSFSSLSHSRSFLSNTHLRWPLNSFVLITSYFVSILPSSLSFSYFCLPLNSMISLLVYILVLYVHIPKSTRKILWTLQQKEANIHTQIEGNGRQ